MKVSCIMPTANRRRFVPAAIWYFLAQDYPHRELIILDDGEDTIADLVPEDSRIRYVRETTRRVIGAKRNAPCEMAQGDIIVHWDDDDWSAPQRLSLQVDALTGARADLCGLSRVLFLADDGRAAWEYIYPDNSGRWVYGATLCYRKAFWRRNPFPEIAVGEDARFVWTDRHARIVAMPKNEFFVALVHAANTSPKRIKDGRWRPRPIDAIAAIMGTDWAAYGPARELSTQTGPKGAALVSAAFGIGDIIRVTPLVRVLRRLGYEVDLLIAPDYPAAVELFGRSPELRRVIHYPRSARTAETGRCPNSRNSGTRSPPSRPGALRSHAGSSRIGNTRSTRPNGSRSATRARSKTLRGRSDGRGRCRNLLRWRRAAPSTYRQTRSRCIPAASPTGRGRSGTASTASRACCHTSRSSGPRPMSTTAKPISAAVRLARPRGKLRRQARPRGYGGAHQPVRRPRRQ